MTPKARVLISALVSTILSTPVALAQNKVPEPVKAAQAPAKAAAYYNFAMGHLYAEMAAAYGNREEYVNKAIEHYQTALKLDPTATFLSEELTELYLQSGQVNRAVTEAQDLLKQNPDNLDAHRVLGRIYARMIGDGNTGKINEDMLSKSVEQFEIITSKDPKDVDSWLTLGRLYRVQHKSPEAEKAFKQALQADPENDEALTGLAMVYGTDLGDTKAAAEMLKRAGDKHPDVNTFARLAGIYESMRDYADAADAMKKAIPLAQESDQPKLEAQLGSYLVAARKLDEALALYLSLEKTDEKDVEIPWQLTEIYRQKGQFDKAHEQLNKAKQLAGDNMDVRNSEVKLLDAEGKTDAAITALNGMLDDTLKSNLSDADKARRAQLFEELGSLYRSANKTDKAIAAFRQIAALEPDEASPATVEVIETYRLAHNLKAALQEADAALKKFPEDKGIIVEHATVLGDLNRTDEAVSEIRGVMKGDKDRELLLMISQIYEKGKKFKEEEQVLNEAAALSKSTEEKAGVEFARGAMFERMKNYDAAEASFRKVIADQPDNAGALNYLGYMLADNNVRLEEAQKLIARAVELDPQNYAYLDSLGWVYYRQNRLEQAEDSLRKAIERVSTDPTVHDHLGDVYLKQGKVKEAITQWQASLNEWKNSPPAEADSEEVAKVSRKLENAKTRIAKETH